MLSTNDILLLIFLFSFGIINIWFFWAYVRRRVNLSYFLMCTLCSMSTISLVLYSNRHRIMSWTDDFNIQWSLASKKDQNNSHCKCNKYSMQVQKDDYTKKHRPLALKTTGNRFIEDNQKLKKLLTQKNLVQVYDEAGYYIQYLQNSSKHLTPLAKKRLKELGLLFRRYLSGTADEKSYFIVSSVTRTHEQQKAIRKVYPKTATYGKSTHSYGVSVDLSGMMFQSSCGQSLRALERAIDQMQGEGKLLVCPESNCIHLTFIG